MQAYDWHDYHHFTIKTLKIKVRTTRELVNGVSGFRFKTICLKSSSFQWHFIDPFMWLPRNSRSIITKQKKEHILKNATEPSSTVWGMSADFEARLCGFKYYLHYLLSTKLFKFPNFSLLQSLCDIGVVIACFGFLICKIEAVIIPTCLVIIKIKQTMASAVG